MGGQVERERSRIQTTDQLWRPLERTTWITAAKTNYTSYRKTVGKFSLYTDTKPSEYRPAKCVFSMCVPVGADVGIVCNLVVVHLPLALRYKPLLLPVCPDG